MNIQPINEKLGNHISNLDDLYKPQEGNFMFYVIRKINKTDEFEILRKIIAIFASIVLAVSIVGLPILIFGAIEWKRQAEISKAEDEQRRAVELADKKNGEPLKVKAETKLADQSISNTQAVNPTSEMTKQETYKKAAQLISDADVLFISAGAGMGVPGGLGTFRGAAAGVWPPLEKLGLKFQDMSNPARFKDDDKYGPNWAWSFWKWRYCAYTKTPPHDGYRYLLDWSKKKEHPSFVFTTNIDGHFLKAGFENVLERHGTVQFLQCQRLDPKCPNFDKKWLPEEDIIENLQVNPETDQITSPLPTCPGCKKTARPTVLMFRDSKVLREQIDKQTQVYEDWKKQITQSGKLKMVAIEIGAGIAIPTARKESEAISREFSCPLIRINPEYPEIKNAASTVEHISITEGAGEALEKINEAMQQIHR